MNGSAGSQGDASISNKSPFTLGAAIGETAQRNPDRVALSDGAERRTYAELARQLEESTRDPGAKRRALRVGNSIADVELILRESCRGTSLLLMDAKATDWELERAESLFVEGAEPEEKEGPRHALGLCTSGSSGLPKVVELDWESVLLNARSFAAAAGYEADDVLWCTTPLAHLYCLGAGVLGGLLSGATVLLSGGMLEGAAFADLAREQRPTVLLSVPFLFRHYLKTLRGDPEIVRSWQLRRCIAAGEPVSPELIETWRELTGIGLQSHYGLTEGGQITLAAGGAGEGVGPPLDDVELRIGEDGQVAVRRRAPGCPYRIVGQPVDRDGWYETGDLGEIDEAGNLHITGRADSRINVAGKKVDPAEVEAALGSCEGVEDCAVASIEAAEGVQVVAFLCVAAGSEIGDGEIRAALAGRLSPHKLPRRFVRVAEIPRTLTGKVRRGDLILGLDQRSRSEPADDGSTLELVRREAASVVLGHPSADAIAPELSFKELGFDSLAAVSLCESLARATGLILPATAVFDYPSPVALAGFIRTLAAGSQLGARSAARMAFRDEPIAIVGIACRYPGGVASPRISGDCSPPAPTRSLPSPPTAAGTQSAFMTQTPTSSAPATCARAASLPTPASSTPSSSASARARRWRWTPSSGSCSKPPGRPSRTPASIHTPAAGPRRGSLPG